MEENIIVTLDKDADIARVTREIEDRGCKIHKTIPRFRMVMCYGDIDRLDGIEGIGARQAYKFSIKD